MRRLSAMWGKADRKVLYRLAASLVLSAAGVTAIVTHEGQVNTVYLDPVGIPTVCVGHTGGVTEADVGKAYSDAVCADLLREDSAWAAAAVRRYVTEPISQPQFDALVSFTFNVGTEAFRTSTLLRRLNAGDCHAAAAQFDRWIRARGRVLPGLVKRRAAERALFEADCPVGEAIA
jgi:lysozyme